jgi:hypothetical protein
MGGTVEINEYRECDPSAAKETKTPTLGSASDC